MPKPTFSDVFIVIGAFAINLALLSRFLIADTGGALLCLSIFLTFFALFFCCLRRGINPAGLLPRTLGRALYGGIAALLLFFSWSEEGLAKDALVALSIVMVLVALLYPLFSIFSDSPTKRTPATPPASPPLPPAAPQTAPRQEIPKQGQAPQALLNAVRTRALRV